MSDKIEKGDLVKRKNARKDAPVGEVVKATHGKGMTKIKVQWRNPINKTQREIPGNLEVVGDIATEQESKMLDQMEKEISRLETDYTGQYRRGF